MEQPLKRLSTLQETDGKTGLESVPNVKEGGHGTERRGSRGRLEEVFKSTTTDSTGPD